MSDFAFFPIIRYTCSVHYHFHFPGRRNSTSHKDNRRPQTGNHTTPEGGVHIINSFPLCQEQI